MTRVLCTPYALDPGLIIMTIVLHIIVISVTVIIAIVIDVFI